MVSKLDNAIAKLKKELFICPYCSNNLYLENKNLHCSNNHTFNIKKNGSIFLLKNNNYKNSVFYDKELFRARRQFILKGYYQKIIEFIISEIKKDFSQGTILDIGCGEGTITNFLAQELKNFLIIGMDYSKDGIDLATDYLQNNTFFYVGDVNNIPLPVNSIDIILDFLSPFNTENINRILKPDGIFIKVIPTKNYLKELRDIYELKKYDNDFHINSNYQIKKRKVIETTFDNLSKEDLKYLANKTPLTWKKNNESLNLKKITISLEMIIMEKND